jgi:hypothetical protein
MVIFCEFKRNPKNMIICVGCITDLTGCMVNLKLSNRLTVSEICKYVKNREIKRSKNFVVNMLKIER